MRAKGFRYAPALVLVALASVPYWATLDAPFVFDDYRIIVDNPALRSGFADIMGDTPYRTMTTLSYALAFRLSPLRPEIPSHLTSLALHAATTLLVALFLGRVNGGRRGAWLGAAMFALHPLATEGVAYLSARATLLATLLALAACIALLSASRRVRWTAPLFLVAALFSKEEALAAAPLMMLLLLRAHVQDTPRERSASRSSLALWLGVIGLVTGVYAVARATHVTMFGEPGHEISLSTTALSSGWTGLHYVRLMLWPVPTSVERTIVPVTAITDVRFLLPMLAAGVLAIACGLRPRLLRGPLLWVVWIPIALSPTLFAPLADPVVEHRAYLALVGFAGVAAWIVAVAGRTRGPTPRACALALLVSAAGLAATKTLVWRSGGAVWRAAHRVAPLATRPLDNLGLAYFNAGDYPRAEWCWRQSLAHDPNDEAALLHLGLLAKEAGRYDEALDYYARALTAEPRLSAALSNSGNIYHLRGDLDAARTAYRNALAINARDADAHYGLGFIARQTGDVAWARREFEATLAIRPTDFAARLFLAEILAQQGESAAAGEHCRILQPLALTPEEIEAARVCPGL